MTSEETNYTASEDYPAVQEKTAASSESFGHVRNEESADNFANFLGRDHTRPQHGHGRGSRLDPVHVRVRLVQP